MIVDWIGQLPVLAVATALIFLPGGLALYLVGMRGIVLAAAAPLFTVATTAVAALVLSIIGVPWSAGSWSASMVLLILIAALGGRWAGGRLAPRSPASPRWLLPSAVAVGVILSVWRVVAYVQDPSGISQTNDAVFHMNAVRYVLETADASSLHVNSVIGGRSFYPAAWHALVSLIVLTSGAEISVAANMLTVVIAAMIWPLGIAWLTRAVTGSSTVAAYAAILSGSLQTFPLLMFQWGVLFPNALSTAMIPAAIALVVTIPRWRDDTSRAGHVTRLALLVLVAAAAILLAQPAGILPWMAICAVWVSWRALARRAAWGSTRTVAALAALWALVACIWLYLAQGTSGSHWPPFRGKREVFLDVLFNGQVMIPFAYAISLLMLVGIIFAARSTGLRWFVVAWAGISGLYLLVAAVGSDIVRVGLLGAWYADPYRIAALAPIVVIPLAALGADVLVRMLAAKAAASRAGAITLLGLAATAVLVIVIVIVRPVAMPAVTQGTYDRESRYLATDDAYLSPDERKVLESLDDLVPAGARVIANPSTGSGFGYFLSGRDVYPRTWAAPDTDAWRALSAHLRDVSTDPSVCEALEVYGSPKYVLDFGAGERAPGRYLMPGMTDFTGQPGFELVDAVGDASLWRITACAQ
ncbi:DUF6541 family protein [Microbacterium sp. AR7-10]|uniref:DUF6541 family protein n=1 Tax=Microbacterium sp. AR7-10 TaxID=1891970 RepID=UPI0008FC3089|nr:DUF6541 family protein [Microbacterium sp. AR7-10]OIU86635.1 hypothetical protein BFN01_10990 [Microbacterium sp. AR7-10]